MKRICHLTSAHNSYDTRIFYKQCVSLAKVGYEVYLVAPGESREESGVHVIGVDGKPISRMRRMTSFTRKVYRIALKLDCEIYHIHDPELLPHAALLAKHGKKVIYDSHEDYPSTVEMKEYLPVPIRKIVSWVIMKYELKVCRRFDAVICCYRWTQERLSEVCHNAELVFNFPIISIDYPIADLTAGKKPNYVCYAGSISKQWNIEVLVRALTLCSHIKLKLAGTVCEDFKALLEQTDGWELVDYIGRVPFNQVFQDVYDGAIAGMALLDYIPQCKYTVGNLSNTKLFEYMYAGLPVICTDFDLWKEIIDRHECGICVNPHNEQEIADAIRFLKNNPKQRAEMGRRSRKAVLSEYNWSTEEQKLLRVYKALEAK